MSAPAPAKKTSERIPALNELTAVVLAGGLGTRLRGAVPDRPKVLAPVAGRPFILHVLNQLASARLRDIVVCTGYRARHVEQRLGRVCGGARLRYSREPTPLGTAGALRCALPHIPSDPCLVLNGDSLYTGDIEGLRLVHEAKRAQATIALVRVQDSGDYGTVACERRGRVRTFREKRRKHRPGWVNAGVYLISRALIETIPWDRPVSLETEMFPQWVSEQLFAYKSGANVYDIGTPERYAAADRFLAHTNAPEESCA